MKTWNMPIVEELEVNMTASGPWTSEIEKIPGMPDFNILGKEKSQS